MLWKKKEQVKKELFFSSIISGKIEYKTTGEYVHDPIGDNKWKLGPLLEHTTSQGKYFLRILNNLEGSNFSWNTSRYISEILNPPKKTFVLWPSDLIRIEADQMRALNIPAELTVERQYSDPLLRGQVIQEESKDSEFSCALLFPYINHPDRKRISERLSELNKPNWKDRVIRKIAVNLLQAIDALNCDGYIYTDFNLSNMFIDMNDELYLDFSNLIFSLGDTFSKRAEIICSPMLNPPPIEFSEPSIVQGRQNVIDYQMQNFSICSLLFYLFFGQYAYDGSLLADYRYIGDYNDLTSSKHYKKFREYHRNPVFIFDANDRSNKIGMSDDEEDVVNLWETCPIIIKQLFLKTLRQGNAERTIDFSNPTPGVWLEAMKLMGWDS